MISVDTLKNENNHISDMVAVLSQLVENPELQGNRVFCDLLDSFTHKVDEHLNHEEREVYATLLNHDDGEINRIAKRFTENTHELRRILSGYVKRWCKVSKLGSDHVGFAQETKDIFRLIEERICMENDHLFPALAA